MDRMSKIRPEETTKLRKYERSEIHEKPQETTIATKGTESTKTGQTKTV